ncbi:MAG: RodZ domain-containing protein [Acidimicrobiales bacterium]
MIVVVIVVLAVLVIAAIVWARVSASRSEHKSVETYEHALGVLGEVSKRTESTGFRILPHEEAGRPHVGKRTDPAGEAVEGRKEASLRGQGPLASKPLPPAGEPKLRFSRPGRPEDGATGRPVDSGVEDGEPRPGATSALAASRLTPGRPQMPGAGTRGVPYRSTFDRRRQVMTRRVATGATAAVAIVAVVVGALYLSGGNGGHPASSTTSTTLHRSSSSGGRTTTTTTTTASLSTTLTPVSTSPVTFTVPSSQYTLEFQATGGACWVGIEQTAAGPWLFAQTIDAGQTATYKGSGSLIVRLGAPVHIGITVDGLTAQLPSGVTQAYSFDLTPAT